MSITPRFLDEVRARVSVSEIVGRSVKLTRAGREFKGCCPFHHEKTPSFTVNDDKQFYHCFGCGAHGDVIRFLQEHNNLGFVDAVEMLATQAGLQMPKSSPEEVAKAKKAKSLYELMEGVTAFFQAELQKPENRDVLDYVQERGLGAAECATFNIGYAPADRQALRRHIAGLGFSDKDMIEAGVIKASTKGSEPYAFFRDRVMFPVADRRGRVVAFGGRALPDHMRPVSDRGFKPPKYINSGDTVLFDKGRSLYAFPQARQAAGDGLPILVTEGYMDVIACHKAGFFGAVAPMGTALTEEQITLIWGMIVSQEKLPILCFDGDNAGRKAATRVVERVMPLLKPDHSVRFAFLPDGKDPDDLIKEAGAKGFQSVLDSALSLVDFLWLLHTQGRDFSAPEARAGVTKTLQDAIKLIADAEVQSHYNRLIREKISATFFAPRESYGGQGVRGRGGKFKAAIKPRRPMQSQDATSKILLAAVINHPHIFDHIEEAFGAIIFQNPAHESFRQAVSMKLSEEEGLDREGLKQYLMQVGFEESMQDILNQGVYIHAAFAAPDYEAPDVLENWQKLAAGLKSKHMVREIQQGWQRVFESGNEKDEQAMLETSMAVQGDQG